MSDIQALYFCIGFVVFVAIKIALLNWLDK
jgi:hypothetical protein